MASSQSAACSSSRLRNGRFPRMSMRQCQDAAGRRHHGERTQAMRTSSLFLVLFWLAPAFAAAADKHPADKESERVKLLEAIQKGDWNALEAYLEHFFQEEKAPWKNLTLSP